MLDIQKPSFNKLGPRLIFVLLFLWLCLNLLPKKTTLGVANLPALGGKTASSAIAITVDGTVLLTVNPDSNSVSLLDLGTMRLVTEVAVGVDPRTVTVDDVAERAYVANRGSDSVSVLDLMARSVITEISVGYRPYGVVVDPAAERLYVSEQGSDQLRIVDTQNLTTLSVISLADRPSGLALSDDGQKLFITHLLGNTITVIDTQVYNLYLPLIIKGSTQLVVKDNPATIYQTSLSHQPRTVLSKSSIQLWPDSNLVQSIVLSPHGDLAYVPHTRSNTGNRALTFDTTVFPMVSLIDLTNQQHLVGEQLDLGTLDPPGVGLPFDAAVTPDGEELWVLNAASNDISVVNLTTRRLTTHIEVGDNPRGIVLSPDGQRAFVNNTLAGTVSVVDTGLYTVTEVITVTTIPLPPVLLNGKRLFHSSDDPRMSRDQWISCNTCHFEGEHDGRTWFFGFAGPRNTTSLLGMIETYPLRWSGEWDESADSEFANQRENFGSGLLEELQCSLSPPDCVHHPPNQGRSYDLDCLAAFIDALQMPPSPEHQRGQPLQDAELRGQTLFSDPALGCVTCHPPPLYTDFQMHDVGTATADERIGPAYDTPSLRGLYDAAPYFHDGSAATLYETLTRPSPGGEHDVRGLLTPTEIQDVIAFLMALPFE